MNEVSIVMITKNSEKHLDEVLSALTDFKEVIILDNGSTDNTLNIIKKYKNVRIFIEQFEGFGRTKNRAISYASNDWVFVLDSDEVMSEELKEEIKQTIKNFKYSAYYVPRLNNFFGKWIKHGGLYPDYSIRLFNKKVAKFNDRDVHESVICKCKKGYLKNHLLHYAYEDIAQFIEKQNRYSSMNPKKSFFKAIIAPYWTFFRMYFLKCGFLDGIEGFIIAKLYSQYTFWKYIKGIL